MMHRGETEKESWTEQAQNQANRQMPGQGRLIIWLSLGFVVLFFIWAAWAEMDEITRGQGRVIPSSQVQAIQNLEGGIVGAILVAEGELVEKSQVLLEMDDTLFMSTLEGQVVNRFALNAKRLRLQAEVSQTLPKMTEDVLKNVPELAARELELYHSRQQELQSKKAVFQQQLKQQQQQQAELQAQRSQLERRMKLLSEEFDISSQLAKSGAVSKMDILRLERQVSDTEGELAINERVNVRLQAEQQETQERINDLELSFISATRGELNETLIKLKELQATGAAMKNRVERTRVRSPVKGIVKQIMVNTEGGVVQPGMKMMEIVPVEDSLLIEVHIKPQDIGFLHPGQKAVVRFTAYDFTVHGGIKGQLMHISADTIKDERGDSFYIAHIKTERNSLGKDNTMPVIAGMVADVDILTGKKSLLSYLLKPVLRAKQLAFSER